MGRNRLLIQLLMLSVLVLTWGGLQADAVQPDATAPAASSVVAPSADASWAERQPEGWLSWWGIPSRDALLLGMWSLHTSPHRHERNTTQNLVGLQYKGYFASTFKNSYYVQSYFAGVSRTIYLKRLAKDLDFDITYKAGLIYGYKDHYPNVGGFSPLIMPTFDFSYKMLGVDFEIFPSAHPVFSVNLRFNLDKFTGGK